MNRDTVIAFIHRIVKGGNPVQSRHALVQLAEILELQGEKESRQLVQDAIEGLQELRGMERGTAIGEAEIRIAKTRAEERQRREIEASRMGRCC